VVSETNIPRRVPVVALVALLTLASSSLGARHFSVVRSLPAADATLDASPETLQVWFSQVPAVGVSQLKLGVAGNEKSEIELGKTAIDAQAKSMTAVVTRALPPGAYVIRWRGAGDDGHVMSGEIKFTFAPTSTSR
jgi:methionine-rich copper-binding protein CopC